MSPRRRHACRSLNRWMAQIGRRPSLLIGWLAVMAIALLNATPAAADNCSAFTDCFGASSSAANATLGLALLTGFSLLLDFTPIVGNVKGVVEAITGKDLLTGQELEDWERALGVLPLLPLAVVGTLARHADEVADLAGATRHTDEVADMAGGGGRADNPAPGAGTRGLSDLGGVIEQTGTNGAGGRIFTSTGTINQNDFAGIVNSSLMRGEDVSILTGAHGAADGSLIADASMLADDLGRFGDVSGVSVHNVQSMSPEEIRAVLEGPGTIIGGFCDSGACLAPFTP